MTVASKVAQYLKDQGITVSAPPVVMPDPINLFGSRQLSCPACAKGIWTTTPNDLIMVDDKVKPIQLRCTSCRHRCFYKDLIWRSQL